MYVRGFMRYMVYSFIDMIGVVIGYTDLILTVKDDQSTKRAAFKL